MLLHSTEWYSHGVLETYLQYCKVRYICGICFFNLFTNLHIREVLFHFVYMPLYMYVAGVVSVVRWMELHVTRGQIAPG